MGNHTKPNISIIIPALNEELSIGFVIKQIREVMKELQDTEIIVVDGGSVDRTPEIARGFGVRVEAVPTESSLGSTMRLGAQVARGSVLVFILADLAYDPSAIPRLVEPILVGSADVVLGSRFMTGSDTHAGAVTVTERFANTLLSFLALVLYRRKINDPRTSFLAVGRDTLTSMGIMELQQPFVQIASLGLQKGLRIREIPVRYGARPGLIRLGLVHDLWSSFLILLKVRLGIVL